LLKLGPLYCHDHSFTDHASRLAFEAKHAGAVALSASTPSNLYSEIQSRNLSIDTIVHNDVHPNQPLPVEAIPLDSFQSAFNALFLFPVHLTQLLLPSLKHNRNGRFVFITSARYRQHEPGFAVATSIRSATTSFATALAREVAPFNIQVNVVAPNYLYSEAYYPRAKFIDDPAGRSEIAAKVPMGRLGQPQEIGELVAFLASGRSAFVTGQTIDFSGGWP
jgi:NAD(P)-dependent dehydrogenase (short-subunit alcohol dehydrogenase family)